MKLPLPKLRWRIQFSLFTLLGLVTVIAVVLGVAPIVRMELALRALSNKDVTVDGNFIGLMVDIDSPAAECLEQSGRRANRRLESALGDPERFAAAHILLSKINQKRIPFNHRHWNEMRVSLYGTGSVDFHAEQIPQLQEFWRNHLAKQQPSPK